MPTTSTARRLWQLYEPYHAVTYFEPESRQALADAGLRGFWMGYFAGRAAPLGAVSAGAVVATFYNFAPGMVRRAVPDAWSFCPPERVLEARLEGVDRALHRILGDRLGDPALAEAADLACFAAEHGQPGGRPLYAANAELDWPGQPHLRLWQALTCLREERGDAHVACLAHAGLDGLESHVTLVGAGTVDRQVLQPNRGWTDQEWAAAVERLLHRGWVDTEGHLTEAGRARRRRIEKDTDRLAEQPWHALGERRTERLGEVLSSLAPVLAELGNMPQLNPIGLPRSRARQLLSRGAELRRRTTGGVISTE